MFRLFVTIATLLAILDMGELDSTVDEGCNLQHSTDEYDLDLSIRLRKNKTGDWVTSFSVSKDLSKDENGLDLSLRHRVIKCGDKHVVHLTWVIKEDVDATDTVEEDGVQNNETSLNDTSTSSTEGPNPKLGFHQKTGKNIILINNGRTAYRKDPQSQCCYGGLFSNRVLKNDELFEVIVDEISSDWTGSSLILAVAEANPEDFEFPGWTGDISGNVWLMEYSSVFLKRQNLTQNYGFDLRTLKVGDRVGVMRRSSSKLHFFYNGKDYGPASSDIPESVYGIVEIRGYVSKVSLVP